MNLITIELPKKALEEFKKRVESEGKTLEELISEATLKHLNINDSESRVELHLKLCEKYIREAEEFLAKKDYVQASEKAWGAASQIIKAIAVKEGRELRSHAALWEYADILAEKIKDSEFRYLWRTANALHQNFYENWMPPREVEFSIKDIKNLIEKLKKFL
jgi:hypothetical protein